MNIGKCLCGEVKFELASKVRWVGACHCRMCQRLSGGAFQIWASFHASAFKLLSGQLRKFQSSSNVIRSSCATCSSHLFFEYIDNDKDLYVAAPALEGADLKPEEHIWWNSKAEWLCMNDGISTRPE